MQRVLRKRVLRDFRENSFRYLALGLLIVFCMYIVISLVGAADTIMTGSAEAAGESLVEDGEFTTFVPLTQEEEDRLRDLGITLEAQFYLDYRMEDASTLRVFADREKINLVLAEQGTLPQAADEVVLEKRYCEEHQIAVGDEVAIGDETFSVTGIGCVPDYDAPYQKLSDSTVDSSQFGLAFVTADAYETLKEAGKSARAEEYVYAYRDNGAATKEEIKETLKDFSIQADEIDDPYFKEYWEDTGGMEEEIRDGIRELSDGSKELSDGLDELTAYKEDLSDGAAQVFDAYLKEASDALQDYGLQGTLTEDNYAGKLAELKNSTDNALLRLKLYSLNEQLDALNDYKNGVAEYTDGVDAAADGAAELSDGIGELQEHAEELLDEYFDVSLSNLTQFVPAQDNQRIGAASDDQVINKVAGLVAGVIIMILFTYVLSVFVVHSIERESSVIGALYALGVTGRDLMVHYLTLPVIVTVTGSVIGTLLGFSPAGARVQMQDCYAYFSIPDLAVRHPVYLVLYGLLMPAAAAICVNWIIIRKKLGQPALTLIRGEEKSGHVSQLDLGNMGFISRFRIRQMLREMRTGFTVVFGMFISLLIAMLALDCYVMCANVGKETRDDTKYAYMYTYKYPTAEAPEDGTACYARTLKREMYGYQLDVTLLGIEPDNPYFEADVKPGKNHVILSTAAAQKYKIKKGEKIILTDEEENQDYAFTVDGIAQYSAGLYVFMNLQDMRELFGESDDYYNVVFANHELDIPNGRLYATISKEQIEASSDIFVQMMMPMVLMMTVLSAVIFVIVMYLMMKVMIDRSAFGISLVKIFGFRMKEIRKLYLNGNFYIVAVGAAICIPAAKAAMDAIYPMLVSNIACGMNLHFTWQMYAGIYAGILGLYFVINQFLIRKLRSVTPAEVLKNRE